MLEAFVKFWTAFFNSIKDKLTRKEKKLPDNEAQKIEDVSQINLLAIVANTLNNLTNIEATFNIDSNTNNAQIDHLRLLCKKLQQNRYNITDEMLTNGDYFVFPTTDDDGTITNSFVPLSRVRITDYDDNGIKELFAIIDVYEEKNKTFYLVRHHKLLPDGTLEVEHFAENENGNQVNVTIWQDFMGGMAYSNANHIGVGRYKSPANSRGLSVVYGVPLNYGCAALEQAIFNDLDMISHEMNNGKSLIFTDPQNVVKDGDSYKFAENIIPVRSKVGLQSQIDVYNPTIRYSSFYDNLVTDLSLLERQIGVSKGILTENEATATATATAVKRANSDTIAMISKIHDALDVGNYDALLADCVFMNLRTDVWRYRSDWFDPYDDPSEQYERIRLGIEAGYAEKSDGTKWLFPSLDEAQIADKLARIKAEEISITDSSIDRLMNNGA